MTFTNTAQLISEIESGQNQFALRFEPLVYARDDKEMEIISRIAGRNNCNLRTAAMIYSTSWGQYQIMGFNLYGGHLGANFEVMNVGEFLSETELQNAFFNSFVIEKGINYSLSELRDGANAYKFGSLYNGNAKAYGDRILKLLGHV